MNNVYLSGMVKVAGLLSSTAARLESRALHQERMLAGMRSTPSLPQAAATPAAHAAAAPALSTLQQAVVEHGQRLESRALHQERMLAGMRSTPSLPQAAQSALAGKGAVRSAAPKAPAAAATRTSGPYTMADDVPVAADHLAPKAPAAAATRTSGPYTMADDVPVAADHLAPKAPAAAATHTSGPYTMADDVPLLGGGNTSASHAHGAPLGHPGTSYNVSFQQGSPSVQQAATSALQSPKFTRKGAAKAAAGVGAAGVAGKMLYNAGRTAGHEAGHAAGLAAGVESAKMTTAQKGMLVGGGVLGGVVASRALSN